MPKILIVEDEKDLVRLLTYNLEKEGFQVLTAYDGEAGFKLFEQEHPDLVVLDLMLPKMDGLEFLKLVRKKTSTPIIMLTAKKEEIDRVLGLELGADDYVTKPFSIREVIARIRGILRRASQKDQKKSTMATLGEVTIDLERYEVRLGGKKISLSSREFDFLKILIEADGKVVTREKFMEKIWGHNDSMELDTRTVDQHISRLRDKLGKESKRVLTVKNVGYRIVAE